MLSVGEGPVLVKVHEAVGACVNGPRAAGRGVVRVNNFGSTDAVALPGEVRRHEVSRSATSLTGDSRYFSRIGENSVGSSLLTGTDRKGKLRTCPPNCEVVAYRIVKQSDA